MTQTKRLGRFALVVLLAAATTGCGLLNFGTGRAAPVPVETGANPFLYQASLDTLSFLPLQSADQSTGRIEYGYGRAPGSGQSYQVSVFVSGPVLDARTLNVAVRTPAGGAPASVRLDLTDAILTRARQLRVASLQQ